MKKLSKAICILLSAVSSLTLFSCNVKNTGVKGTLSIASFEGGYGNTWTQALADAYKANNPEANVEVTCNALVRDDAVTALNTNITSVDLFFIDGASIGSYVETYGSMSDLSELYTLSPKSGTNEENTTVGNKIMPEILSEMAYGGDQEQYKNKYYTVPSPSGPCSLILNTDALDNVFGAGNWKEPKTTDELIALADAIIEKNAKVNVAGVNYSVYPFIYGGDAVEYWRYMYYPWIAQYDGIENWDDYQSVKSGGVYSQDAYRTAGKEKAYSVIEKILKRSNGYCDSTSMNNKFTASQKYFFQGRACMFVTGDWLEREMENATEYKANLKMIRTPVISDLSAKLETKTGTDMGATAAEKDALLSNIITAVDKGETSLNGVPEQLFSAVKESRSITFTLANSAIGFVPSVSVNKEMAIDFLRFMYSDEGIKIILKEAKSYLPVINADQVEMEGAQSDFRKSVNAIAFSGNVKYLYNSVKDPIRYRAGLDVYIGNEKPEVAMGKKTGALTAIEYLDKESRLLGEKWQDYMKVV